MSVGVGPGILMTISLAGIRGVIRVWYKAASGAGKAVKEGEMRERERERDRERERERERERDESRKSEQDDGGREEESECRVIQKSGLGE